MLVLSRTLGEKVVVGTGANAVTITIAAIDRAKVRLAFDAPRDIEIDREEIRLKKLEIRK